MHRGSADLRAERPRGAPSEAVTAPAAPPKPRRLLLLGAALFGLAVLVLLVLLADGRQLIATLRQVDPVGLVAALVLTLLSYAAMARSYQGIADAAGYPLPFPTWLRITFVSNTANYVVTSAGLSGFAVRMYLLGQHAVPSGRCVLISLVQTFLTNFTLLLFIVAGFVAVVVRGQLEGGALIAASIALALFGALLIYGLVLVLRRRLRRLTLLFLANATHRVLRLAGPRWTPRRVRMWRFQHGLDQGFEFLLARTDRMRRPVAWICLDWLLTIGVLWASFHAVRQPVSLAVVLVGFAIGLLFSLVSITPGGLGIMEGSMTAMFVTLGVPLEPTVVAVLLFRFCYHLIPLVLSMFLFHGVYRQAMRAG